MSRTQDISNTVHQKNKSRKDYLYKIGRLKQNRMLFGKENDGNAIIQDEQPQKKEVDLQEQESFDFDLCIPIPSPQNSKNQKKQEVDFKITSYKYEILKEMQPKSKIQIKQHKPIISIRQQNTHIDFDNKNTLEVDKKIQRQNTAIVFEQKSQQKIQNKCQVKINAAFQPFVFQEGFDQQDQPQQEEQVEQIESPSIATTLPQKNKTEGQQSEQSQSLSRQSQREIKGVSITSNSLQGNVFIKIVNKKQLVLSRLPPGIILKCIIRKSSDIFNPQYDFYLNNGLKHILSAKKNSLSSKQIFKLSLQLGSYKGKDIIGKITANTIHNVYWIYRQYAREDDLEYQIKGTIRYDNIIANQPRKMKVQLCTDSKKQIKVQKSRINHQTNIEADLILNNIINLQKQTSVKNFVLVDQQDNEYQYLKMNKISDNMFEVQIQHPLSPIQAFGIALTRFDAQLK